MQKLTLTLVGFVLAALCSQTLLAQEISVHQYRHVPQENIDEFIFREVNYWREVAQKAIDEDKLEFWALFQKVGGYDLPNSSNFLFINTFSDMDAEGIWNPSAVFPDVPMGQMETGSLSKVTSELFVQPVNWVEPEDANPAEEFNYVVINYWNSSDPQAWLDMENEHWAPFIKGEMMKDETSMKAWGNARVLAPQGGDMGITTLSYDLFATLHSALIPQWDEDAEFPEEAMMAAQENLLDPRSLVVYRIVAVATSDE